MQDFTGLHLNQSPNGDSGQGKCPPLVINGPVSFHGGQHAGDNLSHSGPHAEGGAVQTFGQFTGGDVTGTAAGGTIVKVESLQEEMRRKGYSEESIKDLSNNEKMVISNNVKNLPAFVDILDSVCLMKWKGEGGAETYGTAFTAKSKQMLLLITAGHNFKDIEQATLGTYELSFHHDFPSEQTFLLKDLILSPEKQKHLHSHNANANSLRARLESEDYAVFFLDKTKLKDKSRVFLELSEDDHCTISESLVIFGHPVRREAGKSETFKLRMSIGNLDRRENPKQGHRLFYTNGASPGLSGGPVMALYGEGQNRRYKVLAIHSGGTMRDEVMADSEMINYGQVINRRMLDRIISK